jgi:hypothetical protein
MKITRRQLRKLIREAIEAGPRGVWRVPRGDRSPRVSTGKLTKDRFHGTAPKKKLLDLEDENLQSLLQHDDESFKEMGYDIGDASSEVMPGSTKAAFEDDRYAKVQSLGDTVRSIFLPEIPPDWRVTILDQSYLGDRRLDFKDKYVSFDIMSADEVLNLDVTIDLAAGEAHLNSFIRGMDPTMPYTYEFANGWTASNIHNNPDIVRRDVLYAIDGLISHHPSR